MLWYVFTHPKRRNGVGMFLCYFFQMTKSEKAAVWRASLSSERLAAHKARVVERQRERRAEMSEEQKSRLRLQGAKYAARYRKSETPEQRADRLLRLRARATTWRAQNPEKAYLKSRNWRRNNAESNAEYMRRHHLHKKYGITPEIFAEMLKSQNGMCAICLTDDPVGKSKQWHVDHCHTTGKVRGLLCDRCNRGLGYFLDSPDVVQTAAEYLRHHAN